MLRDISQRFHESPDMVAPNVRQIADHFEQAWYQNRAGTFDMYKLDRVAIATAQSFDMFYGGMIGAPKFPNVPLLELLVARLSADGNAAIPVAGPVRARQYGPWRNLRPCWAAAFRDIP